MKNKSVRNKNRFMVIAFVMIALIHAFLPMPVSAEEVPGAGTVPVTFSDERQLGEVMQIRLPFPDVTGEKVEWSFPYSDEFFLLPAEEFSITMARGSMGLTLSAFRSAAGIVSPQYETYLREAGFTDIYSFGYDKPPLEDSLSGVIGRKRIGDCTVIAAAACGQGYGNEWASNFKVGSGERHEGFSQAAGLFEDHLTGYLKDLGIKRVFRLLSARVHNIWCSEPRNASYV